MLPMRLQIFKAAHYDLIIVETSGIGQSGTEVIDIADVYMYVMTPEFGAATQLEKIDMLDYADLVAINKFDKRGAQDALRDVKKQYQRNRNLWNKDLKARCQFLEVLQLNLTILERMNYIYISFKLRLLKNRKVDWKSSIAIKNRKFRKNIYHSTTTHTLFIRHHQK
jgi:methylmalonyl-CoA mutase